MRLHLVRSTPERQTAQARPDRLDDLYEAHAHEVKRWARRLAGPHADIEDLMHDVFVIALGRHFTFRGEADIRTWLFRITNHVVSNRRRRSFLRSLLLRRHQDDPSLFSPSPSTPQEELERGEQHVRLYAALDKLADCYRTTVILYEIEGLSGDEVAKLTGVSLGTVWVRLHRGRARLLKCLREEERR